MSNISGCPRATATTGSKAKSLALRTVEQTIDELNEKLRALSLDIHDHPEIMFKEYHAHDVLTAFMESQGFEVTRHFILETGWKASWSHGTGGRTIGVNSEMDALPGIGHACGHNLIAISGVAVACAIKAALAKHNISGTVVLLGTPGEEGGQGKVTMHDEGGYDNMDAVIMSHPAPGPDASASLSSCLALRPIRADYTGHTAHAALSPWEGTNALDAAVLAYNNVAVLRQQMKPTHRMHGTFSGKEWATNVIPNNSHMEWLIRAPTKVEVDAMVERVVPCFEAAALATGCKVKIDHSNPGVWDLHQNRTLGDEFASVFAAHYGPVNYGFGIAGASTDFGNITYAFPSLHPSYAIPTIANGGNHTPEFTESARTLAAHTAALNVSKALAATGLKCLADDSFFAKVKKAFEDDEVAGPSTS